MIVTSHVWLVNYNSNKIFIPQASVADYKIPKAVQNEKLQIHISVGQSSAELRGAAYLRGLCFTQHPPSSPVEVRKSFVKAKSDEEWKSLEGKVAGVDEIWKNLRVVCLIATTPSADDSIIVSQLNEELDKSTKLIPQKGNGSQTERNQIEMVVGTLDVNVGVKLPSEDLIANLPKESPKTKRAYISNVCVAPSARRQGIAKALIDEAKRWCVNEGIQYLYVHVEESNIGAKKLYEEICGFELENQESAQFAMHMRRSRRFLLRQQLQ